MNSPVRIGTSACLLGDLVRFDGGHKRDRFITGPLSEHVELVRFCPEVEAGLPIPRPSLRHVATEGGSRVVEPSTGVDQTDALEGASADIVERVIAEGLDGFILKAGSPSCGLERVRIYSEADQPNNKKVGQGVFAKALVTRLPLLPVEEEGRLNDPRLRENFFLRVFTRRRFIDEVRGDPSRSTLMAFHARQKMILLAHDEARARRLGRHLAEDRGEIGDLVDHYERELFAALATPAKRRGHQNALHHMAGFTKSALSAEERNSLDNVIRRYGTGQLPLAAVMTLLRMFHLRDLAGYGAIQLYAQPHPEALGLYNHI